MTKLKDRLFSKQSDADPLRGLPDSDRAMLMSLPLSADEAALISSVIDKPRAQPRAWHAIMTARRIALERLTDTEPEPFA